MTFVVMESLEICTMCYKRNLSKPKMVTHGADGDMPYSTLGTATRSISSLVRLRKIAWLPRCATLTILLSYSVLAQGEGISMPRIDVSRSIDEDRSAMCNLYVSTISCCGYVTIAGEIVEGSPIYVGDCDKEMTAVAYPADKFTFDYWQGRCVGGGCLLVIYRFYDNPLGFTPSSLGLGPNGLIAAVFKPVPFTITRQPEGAALYEGFPYRFTVLAEDGVGAFSYSWRKDGVGVGGDTPYLDIGSATALDAGEYWCRINDGYTTVETNHVPLAVYLRAPSGHHAADTNRDWQISLHELLRLVQFHNTGAFHCREATEDGYAPGTGDIACAAHNADYDVQDWQITMNELLRVVQFFNAPGGAYHADSATEDGYAPQAG